MPKTEGPPWRAGDVMDLLGLERLTYQRLGHLAALTDLLRPDGRRPARPVDLRSWRWFEHADVARIAVVIEACGGRSAFTLTSAGKHPRLRGLGKVREAGAALRTASFGLDDPLLQVPWVRQGGDVLVILDGQLLNPVTNQIVASLVRTTDEVLGGMLQHCDERARRGILGELRYIR